MASPQKENGNTPIANEIVEALAKTHLSSYETQVIFSILRKTYGWHKKEDWIALSQLSDMTGILRQHIARTITKLKKRNIIIKNNNKTRFNKNYDEWDKVLPKMVLPKQVVGATNLGNQVLPKMVHTKESITKETIQKKDERQSFNSSSFKWKKELLRHKMSGGKTMGEWILTESNGLRLLMKKDENNKKVWKTLKQYKIEKQNEFQRNKQ